MSGPRSVVSALNLHEAFEVRHVSIEVDWRALGQDLASQADDAQAALLEGLAETLDSWDADKAQTQMLFIADALLQSPNTAHTVAGYLKAIVEFIEDPSREATA